MDDPFRRDLVALYGNFSCRTYWSAKTARESNRIHGMLFDLWRVAIPVAVQRTKYDQWPIAYDEIHATRSSLNRYSEVR